MVVVVGFAFNREEVDKVLGRDFVDVLTSALEVTRGWANRQKAEKMVWGVYRRWINDVSDYLSSVGVRFVRVEEIATVENLEKVKEYVREKAVNLAKMVGLAKSDSEVEVKVFDIPSTDCYDPPPKAGGGNWIAYLILALLLIAGLTALKRVA